MIKKVTILLITFALSTLLVVGLFIYYLSEKPVKESQIEHKRPNDGYYLSYYDDGTIRSEEHYDNGLKDGLWKTYYPDGRLEGVMKYKKGKLVGERKHYSITGQLIFTEEYRSGILVDMHIWDDSLYKYESNLMAHGRQVYRIDCSPCHEAFDKGSISLLEGMVIQRDTSDVKFMVLDSLHKPYLIPAIEQDSLNFEDNCLFVFNKEYDLHAVIEFIKKQKQKNNVKPVKMKKLKIKSKTS